MIRALNKGVVLPEASNVFDLFFKFIQDISLPQEDRLVVCEAFGSILNKTADEAFIDKVLTVLRTIPSPLPLGWLTLPCVGSLHQRASKSPKQFFGIGLTKHFGSDRNVDRESAHYTKPQQGFPSVEGLARSAKARAHGLRHGPFE